MKTLKHIKLARPEYKEHCEKLQEQLKDEGYEVDIASISRAWQDYSDVMCAGWMGLQQTPGNNVANILPYLTELQD